jgi:hypothetical protein
MLQLGLQVSEPSVGIIFKLWEVVPLQVSLLNTSLIYRKRLSASFLSDDFIKSPYDLIVLQVFFFVERKLILTLVYKQVQLKFVVFDFRQVHTVWRDLGL